MRDIEFAFRGHRGNQINVATEFLLLWKPVQKKEHLCVFFMDFL